MDMNELPFEVLCVIYSFSPNLKNCNKYYNSMCQIFKIKDNTKVNYQLSYLAKKKKCIGLSLNNCKSLNAIGYNQLPKLNNLKYLSLSETPITNRCLDKIYKLPNLVKLNISNCINITTIGFKNIYQLNKLQQLIMDNILVSASVYKYVAQLKNLKVLSIKGCYITDDSVKYINTMSNLVSILCNNSFATYDIFYLNNNIQLISLSSIRLIIPKNIESSIFYQNYTINNNIRILALDNLKITDNFINILKHCVNLSSLSIQNCLHISTTFVNNFNRYLKHLKIINITNCHQLINYDFHDLKSVLHIICCIYMVTKHNFCKKCKYSKMQSNSKIIMIKKCKK